MTPNNDNSSENQNKVHNCRYRYCLVVLVIAAFILVMSKFKVNPNVAEPKYIKDFATWNESYYKVSSKSVKSSQVKIIMVWTKFFGSFFFPNNLTDLHCPSLLLGTCFINRDKKGDPKEADAIVFHVRNVNPHDLPPERSASSKQVWVLYNYESPAFVKRNVYQKLNQKIDVTVSYRRDSDIFAPYGRLKPRTLPFDIEYLNETEFNNKLPAVSLVSDCRTSGNREGFIKQLNETFNVDVFGHCGKPAYFCSKGRRSCYQELSKRYKFFFSFENAISIDYISEKFYLALAVGMVPVVFGGADYSIFIPTGSYINALDFETPKLLGEYLDTVAQNFTLYQQYFEWKENYTLDFSDFDGKGSKRWICDLCNYLHQEENQKPESWRSKHRRNIEHWWFAEKVGRWPLTRKDSYLRKNISEKSENVFNTPLKDM